ncbi:MAG: chemotaxis-specific protein-glutamate methyltransferase CheB [Pseudomonadota bacterium]
MTIKVLVVDDSALMRKKLRAMLEDEDDFSVETARDGLDALEKVASFQPDVVTLDINMPQMDGITCLDTIMERQPLPVVMVSSLTREGAAITMKAIEHGAVGFVEKPGGTISRNIGLVRAELVDTIRAASRAHVRARRACANRRSSGRAQTRARRILTTTPPRRLTSLATIPGLILVGVSTGGPPTIEVLLSALPKNLRWPIVIAQHMPEHFTSVFARRLDSVCALDVIEVDRVMPLTPGAAYIARGGSDLEIRRRLDRLTAHPVPADPDHAYHPSVDRMVSSALSVMPASDLVGVLLTGMGRDGADAMARLHRDGGRTIAESEETAVVFGMPGALVETGHVSAVEPNHLVAQRLLQWTGGRKRL